MSAKNLLITVVLFCGFHFGYSQSSYYYYKGNKIPLQEDLEKVSVIAPKGELKSISIDVKQIEKINDNTHDITVYRANVAKTSLRNAVPLRAASFIN